MRVSTDHGELVATAAHPLYAQGRGFVPAGRARTAHSTEVDTTKNHGPRNTEHSREWCWDYSDPARYADYRVLRGGGWADKHWSVRASVRRGSMPGAQLDDVGFRVTQGRAGEAGTHAGQGWSQRADADRATIGGPLPIGWTPLLQARADQSHEGT